MEDEDEQRDAWSRRDLLRTYRASLLRPGAEVRLLGRAARFLRGSPEPGGPFTVFPFRQAVVERLAESSERREQLAGLIRAAEMLERVCRNLVLQPWRKEIRSLKTFTGAFVYCLLPVLSRPTIQSLLAFIGYLPSSDASQSEFTLSSDADADRALLMGFELLLVRVQCCHLLDLLVEHQLGPKEWLDVLHRRNMTEATENHTVPERRKDNNEKTKPLDKMEETFDSKPSSAPQLKPLHYQLIVDPSVMELKRKYPDLAFRGRPLLADQPNQVPPATGITDDEPDVTKDSEAASPPVSREADGYNDVVVIDQSDSSGLIVRNSAGAREDDEHPSGPQAFSLHITLRTGARPELNPESSKTHSQSH